MPTHPTLRSLFSRDVTRAIPPVVYFHEQSAERLQAEVDEYIVTGGFPPDHPAQRRVPIGIHEQLVALLRGILTELDAGATLPTAWVSGFYGSGKSSFAKLIGLALDRHPPIALPDGRLLSDALLARDLSPRKAELHQAFSALLARLSPLAVVFDVGGTARDHEHIHAVALRQVQARLGYAPHSPEVADFELRLEQAGDYARFLALAPEVLGAPWSDLLRSTLVDEHFSLLISHLYPQHYPDPMAWQMSRGSVRRDMSPQEVCLAIRDMRTFRAPDATLFLVADEVSQYIIGHHDRIDRLRAFATELGSSLKGKVWFIALGQQKLDEQADPHRLGWMKDRFPPKLQLHLAPTNIRDVIHRRLLAKTPAAETQLRELFATHRARIALHAYEASDISADDFVEVYPLLPNHIDLLLQVTSAIRQRSARAQGDDHGIRGVLQLLGELFRSANLASAEVGSLVTFDLVYDVIHTALDADLQASMARVLAQTVNADPLCVQCAKVVALLEHLQDETAVNATTAERVAACLYDRLDRGDRVAEVRAALESLRAKNLLGMSEKSGYKIQSTAAEEWETERQRIGATREQLAPLVRAALATLDPAKPKLGNRPFALRTLFAQTLKDDGEVLKDVRDPTAVVVDFRWVRRDDADATAWVKRSDESNLRTRIIWVAGDDNETERVARELTRSVDMVARYLPRRDSLPLAKKNLLNHEQARVEDLTTALAKAAADQLMAGRLYFAGRPIEPREHGQALTTVLTAAATRLLPEIYGQFESVDVQPSHLKQLLSDDPTGMAMVFMEGPLQVFELEAGRYVATATGKVPTRVLEEVRKRNGMSGSLLIQHFTAPPFAWTTYMIQAAVAGLVRAEKLEIQPEDGIKVTRLRDPGVRDLFDKDRAFRAADFFVANAPVSPQLRAKVAKLLEDGLSVTVEREEDRLVDAIAKHMPQVVRRANDVLARHARVPGAAAANDVLARDVRALVASAEQLASGARYTERTMLALQKDLDVLRDGFGALRKLDAELTDVHVETLVRAQRVAREQGQQLQRLQTNQGGSAEVVAALATIAAAREAQRPWLDVDGVRAATQTIEAAYRAERERALQWQQTELEMAKAMVRIEPRFVHANADGQNVVMRGFLPLSEVGRVDALAPELLSLYEPFAKALRDALDAAFEALDEAELVTLRALHVQRERAAGKTPAEVAAAPAPVVTPTVMVDLRLSRRELTSAADVEQLLAEVRDRLMTEVRAGRRVRLK